MERENCNRLAEFRQLRKDIRGSSSRDKHFLAYFTNKLRGREKEKGIKTRMRVKLSAKMMIIAWTLMKKKEFFDPKYLNLE